MVSSRDYKQVQFYNRLGILRNAAFALGDDFYKPISIMDH